MGRLPFVIFGVLAGAVLAPAHGSAQREARHTVELTPYAGYMLPTDLVSGPLGTRVSVTAAPVWGGQLGFVLFPGVALVGNVAYSEADVDVGAPIVGGISVGRSETLLFDGGLQLSMPGAAGRAGVRPFLQVGAGAIQRDLSVWELTARSTSVAFHGALGVDVGFAPGVGLRLMAKDNIGKFDFQEAVLLDYDGDTMHNVSLTAGLEVAF